MRYAAFLIIGFVICVQILGIGASTAPTWKIRACGTLDCVTSFLNSLPPQAALGAKVTTINSQRSFMGALSDPYYIWYIQ